MIVLDGSAAIEWLLRTDTGLRVEERIFARAVTALRGQDALDDLSDLALTRYPHDVLLGRMWELRDNLTAYDAAYVALAEALDAPLVTCDAKLASAPGHRARIEAV